MDFSVIVASRNRPVLVREAIQSVLMQSHPSFEIILVNDGSSEENMPAYRSLLAELGPRVRSLNLVRLHNGHGQSYALNRGAELAAGAFLCFLDDDDFWTDPHHLSRAWACLHGHGVSAELYLANQQAYLNDVRIARPHWLEPLEADCRRKGLQATGGAYRVSVEDLMACEGFCHLNTTIIARDLFRRIDGLDESVRYENDLDFYLRHIDQAQGILYYPGFVARHNAPDPSKTLNMSTSVSYLQKMLYRTYVWNKARMFGMSPPLRAVAARNKGYTLRKIALKLVEDRRVSSARSFAWEALASRFSIKWLLYCIYLSATAVLKQDRAPPTVGTGTGN